MVAAAMGRLPVCQELILRGVNVNHVDSSSLHHTALTLAAEAGYADVVSHSVFVLITNLPNLKVVCLLAETSC